MHQALKEAVTGKGVVVYDSCFGIATAGSEQEMANLYGMNVLTSSLGYVQNTPTMLMPTIADDPNDIRNKGGITGF